MSKTDTFSIHIPSSPNSCKVQMQRQTIRALIDTGSELTLLHKRIYDALTYKMPLRRKDISLHSANGSSLTVHGVVELKFKIHGLQLSQEALVVSDLSRSMILGRDFLSKNNARIYYDLNRLRINKVYVPMDLDAHISALVRSCENVTLRPQSVSLVHARVRKSPYFDESDYSFEPVKRGFLTAQPELKVMPALVNVKKRSIPVQIVNTSNKTLRVRKGCVLGTLDSSPRSEVNGVFTRGHNTITEEEFCEQINVSEEDRPYVQPFLLRNKDVFAFSDLDLKQTDLCTADIDTGDHAPINVRPYRIAYNDREIVSQTIDDLLEAGLIERSASCWSFPLVMVDKKPEAPGMPSKRRMCIDFRKLNEIVHIRSFPLPLIDDIIARLNGTTYFTTVDLRSGFHQIPLTKDAKEKCSFSCWKGKFSFKCMPFGLRNAPSEFQRMVTRLLESCEEYAVAYVDDILIHTKSDLEDHLRKVQEVINRIRKHSLRLKLNKCQWAKKEIHYLGYKVSQKGIAPDEGKVEAIRNLKSPESVKEVRSFLGAVGYFRKMIPRFADISAPLIALTKKYARFKWTPECQKAFEDLKAQLTVVPLLAHADPRASYRLYTDASSFAVGACLCQKAEDGETWVPGIPNEKPIYFLSHKLPDSKARALDVAQKELYAMVYALDKLHHFLYGAEFEIFTDHQPLKYLFSAEQKNRRIQAWSLNVNSYNCKIRYLKGTENVMADLLSRSPSTKESTEEDFIPEIRDDALECAVLNSNNFDPVDFLEVDQKTLGQSDQEIVIPKLDGFDLKMEQSKDTEIMELKYKLERHGNDVSLFRKYLIKDDVVFYISQVDDEPKLRLYVPAHLRKAVFKQYHEQNGHMSVNKTFLTIKEKYYWPNLWKELDMAISRCVVCKQRNLKQQLNPVQETGMPPYPMAHLQLDLSGPHRKTLSGNQYLCTFIDVYSGWPEVFCLADKTAQSVVECLLEYIIPRHSCPLAITSDNGKEMDNRYYKETLERLNIKRIHTSTYNPRANGMVERNHATLNNVLSKLMQDHPETWDIHLSGALAAMRMNVSRSTLRSSFELLYSRQPVLPLDSLLRVRARTQSEDYHEMALESLHKNFLEVLKISKKMKDQRNTYANKKRKQNNFKVGDSVYLKNHRKSTKLERNWLTHFVVVEVTTPVSFRVRNQLTGVEYRVHANSLRQADLEWKVPPREGRQLRTARLAAAPPSASEEESSSGTDSDDTEIYDPEEYINRGIRRLTKAREDSESEGDIPQFELLRSSRVLSNEHIEDDEGREDPEGSGEDQDEDRDHVEGNDHEENEMDTNAISQEAHCEPAVSEK